jgi:uncharacterized protein YvpB
MKLSKTKKATVTILAVVLIFCGGNALAWVLGYQDIVTYILHNDDTATISVPSLTQDSYPTGCESTSTVMALNYYGIDMTIGEFIDNYLDMESIVYKNGEMWACDPNVSFVGNPRSSSGFGCYAPVIVKAIDSVLDDNSLDSSLGAKNLTGLSLRRICNEYVSNGIPVIVWATQNMQPSEEGKTWNVLGTDDTFTWKSKEHCLLLVGYDKDYYYFNDPQHYSDTYTKYDRYTVESRYRELGSQAVAIVSNNNE